MEKPEKALNEQRRLETLKTLDVLDTLPEGIFTNITFLASEICGVPIALISLVDESRQWFKAKIGLEATETSRDVSFCGHAVVQDNPIFEVNDAISDLRFADNPLVTDGPEIRFYAGATLQASNGEKIGTLCVIDRKPRKLNANQSRSLRALADQVIALLEARKNALELAATHEKELILKRAAELERKRLQIVFDTSTTGMALVREPDFIFEKVNEAFRKIIGADQYIGKKWLDIYKDQKIAVLYEILQGVYQTGKRHSEKEFTFETVEKDETVSLRYYDLSYDRIEYEGASNHGIIIQAVDVTESIKARNDLVEKNRIITDTQNRLQTATTVAKVGFFECMLEEDIVHFSDQMQKDWGISAGVTLNEILERVVLDDRNKVAEEIHTSILTQKQYRGEFKIQRPDCEDIIWIEAQGKVTYGPDNQPLTFIGTSIDITSRKNSENEVKAIANSIPQLAWTADASGSVDWYNNRWYTYTGSTFKQAGEWGWKSFVHPDHQHRVVQHYRECWAAGTDWDDTFPLLGKSGEYRWFLSRATPIRDESGAIIKWFGTNTDVTSQRENEESLTRLAAVVESAKDAAEKANSAKSAFLANMSHEIRSPLGAIMGFSELLKTSELSREEILQNLSIIDRNSHHLLRIIDDILDLAKVEAGKMQVEQIDFSLFDTLADFSSIMAFRARDKGIEFQLSIDSPIPDIINSDPTRLRQILYNVVGNAIKFTDRGRVLVSVSYKNGTLEFKVKDTGIGLTEDEAGKLFQAFQQADVSTTRKYGGTGLGLALTRKLCEALGGQFNLLSSHAGIGSTFSASIGIVLPEDAVLILNRDLDFVDKSQTTLPSKQRSLQGIKVLVVDDSPDNQLLFSRILSKSGATTSSASDGLEGVEKALSGNFDAVLMDIQMPGMDGHEATFFLRSKGFLKPIIALTAHAMIEERQRALDSGFTDFLSKPLRQEDLLDLLSRVIQVP